jgi:pilus assembly protein CpaE
VPENIGKLLKKARRAYKTGERSAAAFYIDKILRQSYTHRGTWKLLYKEYGSGQSLKDFQREFTEQYYPDRLALILGSSIGEQPGISQYEGRSLLRRIFSPRKVVPGKPGGITAGESDDNQPSQLKDRRDQRSTYARDTSTTPVTKASQLPTSAPPKQVSTINQAARAEKTAPETPVKRPAPDRSPPPEPVPLPVRQDRAGNIRVIVVDDTAQTRETIVRSLSFQREIEIIATAENGMQAITLARQTLPDVVLMDINMPDMDGITATAGVLHEVPYAQVIILTVQDDPDYMRKAMMAGAHDFLTKPPALDELLNAVQNAGKIAHQEKRKADQSMLASSGHAPSLSSRGKIISIYSPKGGVGCSTIAVNLAASLHNDETKAVIVDSNLYFGDITDLFNMQSENTLFDLAMRSGNLDFQMVEETLVAHESGIHLLAPPGPEQAGYINIEQFIDVVENLRDLYPYVLVNTTSHLTEATIAALEISDLVILLVTQDIPTVARVRKFFDTTELLKINPQRVVVVLNQYDKQSEINPDIIGKSIRHNIDALIPRDSRVVVPSVNRGIPFMLRSELKPLPVSRALLDLAEKVRQRLIQVSVQSVAEDSPSSHTH